MFVTLAIRRMLPFLEPSIADASLIMPFADELGLGSDLIDRETHESATAPQNDSRFTGCFNRASLTLQLFGSALIPNQRFQYRVSHPIIHRGFLAMF